MVCPGREMESSSSRFGTVVQRARCIRFARVGAACLFLVSSPAACAAGPGPQEQAPIEREVRLPVEGARLWLLIRGDDRSAPVLLWLHGGPGGAETPLFRVFNGDLERHFVVAYWDQRGAARSYDPDADPAELTVARHLADLDAVVDFLRAELGRERIVLVGHSWGGALGLLYAHAHPDEVSALIGVAPLVAELPRERAQHAFVQAEADRVGDEGAAERLAEIGTPPYSAEQELAVERLVDRFGGLFHQRPSVLWTVLRATFAGYARPWQVPRFIRANEISLAAMNQELRALDLRESVPRLEMPLFFFLGRYDRQVDARIAAAWFEELDAPAKELIWFEHSAHNIPFEEPERFGQALVEGLAAAQVR